MEVAGSPYGHTGAVIEDSDGYTIKTVEQNIDGNWDSLQVGGPLALTLVILLVLSGGLDCQLITLTRQ
ncbi:bacterial SH3 domain protein [Streptococcus dysgalactiae]|nr:bacterial SH3 domain protein [Streptococcus dysgalactiae]